MKNRLIAGVLCASLLVLAFSDMPARAAASLGWSPSTLRLFVVGVLKWKSSDLEGFSVKNRCDQKLVKFFKNSGVPDDQIVYLNNEKATLPTIMTSLKDASSRAKPGDTLLFYYCGHGWIGDDNNGYLANYDAGETDKSCLAVKDVVTTLKSNFRGSQLLMLADCCCSGSIADALKAANPPFKYAVLTSAVASEGSTENWTFSQSVLDTLTGHSFADQNKDAVITFDELGSYIKHEMKELEEQNATVYSGNGFDRNFVFSNVCDSSELVPKNVEVKYEGAWWKAKLLGVKDGQAKIHWVEIGWDSSDDDTSVPLSDVRSLSGKTGKKTAGPASSLPRPGSSSGGLTAGKKVKVLWEGAFYPATILKVNGNNYLVHYDGYQSSDDEWVDTARVK